MNIATIIVLLVIAAWMAFAVYVTFIRKGHSSCDCGACPEQQDAQSDDEVDPASCPHAQTYGCSGCNGCSGCR
ncbi:MAG: hypothetical protein LUD25_02550 [Coriobacteriaceae bacterium]|nr:hypothetical protein [Coriobacteriaceae bacterium]